jgi:hypothetical protein
MKICDLEIVIENIRGSYKKFADTLDEYPVLGVTFSTHYGFIKGYTGEDKHPLDIFLGKGDLIGYIRFKREDADGGLETKVFLHISEGELEKTLESYKPVIDEVKRIESEEEFLDFIQSFRD